MSDVKLTSADSPEAQPLNAMYAMVREIRGTSIDQAIWLDVIVADTLAAFFCPDDEKR